MSIFLLLLYNNKTVCKLLILNVCGICFDVLYVNKMHAETQAELITALSLSTYSHTQLTLLLSLVDTLTGFHLF